MHSEGKRLPGQHFGTQHEAQWHSTKNDAPKTGKVGTVFIASALRVRLGSLSLPHDLFLPGGRDEYGPYVSHLVFPYLPVLRSILVPALWLLPFAYLLAPSFLTHSMVVLS
jgi:hypothetical protein